ncbi:MAG: O-antigen ligase domain-containing protein [Algoriphagus sp.]|nr:O-antigen ligase domain-containing protein [Algoriphagus sp.]
MAVIFFLLIVLGIGVGLVWTAQQIIFKGKWSYFIYFLAAFLPIYITSLSLIFLVTRSAEILSVFQIIKEVIILVAFAGFVFFQKEMFGYPFRMRPTDWMMLGLLTLGFLYLLLPLGSATFVNKALYYKSMLMPGFVYFLGRNTRWNEAEIKRLFSVIFVVMFAAFAVNVVESFILQAHLQQFSGYALYNQVINNIEPTGNFGLTWTFETQAVTKRLAAFFSDPLELASSVLMGFAAGLIWFLTTRREENWVYLLVMIATLGSLVFSASRAAFGAFFIMVFFVALVFKLYRLIGAGFLALVLFGIYVLFFASDDFYFFVLDTITFENSSSLGHVVEWLLALDSMISNPLGIGLAMSGNFGSVENELRVGGENQFLIYGVQLGWLGMLLYILTLYTGIRDSIRVFRTTSSTPLARIAFTGAVVKVGLLLPLFTANVEIYLYVSWLSWWMIGFSLREYGELQNKSFS